MRIFFFFILISSSSAFSSWNDYLNPFELGFPEAHKLLPWVASGYAENEIAVDPSTLEISEYSCPSPSIWATHPFQTTKDYIYAVTASYKNNQHSPAHAVVMSDLFQDECGQIFKGYWIVTFLSSEETMNTLVSKGRTLVKNPNERPGEYVANSTYAVSFDEFLLLTPPTSEDLWKIEVSKENALKEGYFLNHFQWVR